MEHGVPAMEIGIVSLDLSQDLRREDEEQDDDWDDEETEDDDWD